MRIPSVPGSNWEFPVRVDLIRSASRRRATVLPHSRHSVGYKAFGFDLYRPRGWVVSGVVRHGGGTRRATKGGALAGSRERPWTALLLAGAGRPWGICHAGRWRCATELMTSRDPDEWIEAAGLARRPLSSRAKSLSCRRARPPATNNDGRTRKDERRRQPPDLERRQPPAPGHP